MKPILGPQPPQIDEENEHYLVIGAGYEYLHTDQNGDVSVENRLIAEATPRVPLAAGLLLADRNRAEFRSVSGAYDFRYRNKVVISAPILARKDSYRLYGSGELYYDRNHHSWNQNQYGGGVQLPRNKRLMLDIYVLHQNCTSCRQHSVNMIGATLNVYVRRSN